VDQPLVERRIHSRFAQPGIAHIQAILRPARQVSLVNLSAGGALIEERRPLRPGSRVFLQLTTGRSCAGRKAQVLRCMVASLRSHDGVKYRGALRFEDEWADVWEELTLDGYELPEGSVIETLAPVHLLPVSSRQITAAAHWARNGWCF
jgi:hypothetical protein